jgi:mono/diheme cytochrome c family protein
MKGKSMIRNTLGIVLLLAMPAAAWSANEGAAAYKKKCAGCHGAAGEGKPSIKAPALKGTAFDVDKIAQHVTKGEPASKAPHNKGISGITEEQAKAIAEFVKSLK